MVVYSNLCTKCANLCKGKWRMSTKSIIIMDDNLTKIYIRFDYNRLKNEGMVVFSIVCTQCGIVQTKMVNHSTKHKYDEGQLEEHCH